MELSKKIFCVCILVANCSMAATIDDFSGGSWKRFNSTPGEMHIEKGQLSLTAKGLGWVTAAKTFDINLDKEPLLLIKIKKLSARAQVKLVKNNPTDKQSVLMAEEPGLYVINIKEKCKWQGLQKIDVLLYSIGQESEVSYEYIKFTDKLSDSEKQELAATKYKTADTEKTFSLAPLFNSCAYYYHAKAPVKNLHVQFRKEGGKWEKAFAPNWISEGNIYRGSLVHLDENTTYEVAVYDGNKLLESGKTKTWASEVPVGKTIILDNNNFKGTLRINAKGNDKSWIKYTAAPGFVLKNNGETPVLIIEKAEYVLLDGLTIKGGDSTAIHIRNSKYVRLSNCDISEWGIVGKQRFDIDGKYYNQHGRAINYNGAIFLSKSFGTVIERCYVHDPRNTANAWRYSHPAGPEAIMIDKPQSTVIRFNDLIGSNQHRWNDAIEGTGNFHKDGGFNRDADIYGNMMAFGNDDAIEIDGGQQNVRVFQNKMEGFLCGVSIQGCMEGPSYVYNNLIINLGDEFNQPGQSIKTSSNIAGKDAFSYIFNNTSDGNGISLNLNPIMNIVAKNNIFATSRAFNNRKSPKATADYNLDTDGRAGDSKNGIFVKDPQFIDRKNGNYGLASGSPAIGKGISIDNFTSTDNVDMGAIPYQSDIPLPYRPIPVRLNKYQIIFDASTSENSFTAEVKGKNFSSEYQIRKNNVSDWFSITPESGILKSEDKINFTVKLDRSKMTTDLLYKAVFLLRLKNGYSRPVTVYAYTNINQKIIPEVKNGTTTIYLEAENASSEKQFEVKTDSSASGGKYVFLKDNLDGNGHKEPVVYNFNIPQDGKYFVLMRVRSEIPVGSHDSLRFGVDDEEIKDAHLSSSSTWVWTQAANNDKKMMNLKTFDLKAGSHKIKILPRESIDLDMIALTTDPKNFEFK